MPPIVVKNFRWRQTSTEIVIYAPFKARGKDIDIFIAEKYMKATCRPFILELFLYEKVEEENSHCTITNDEVIFFVKKVERDVEWPTLEVVNLSKDEKHAIREKAIETAHLLKADSARKKKEKLQELNRSSVKAQIELDSKIISKIDEMRDEQRRIVMTEFQDWKSKSELPILVESDKKNISTSSVVIEEQEDEHKFLTSSESEEEDDDEVTGPSGKKYVNGKIVDLMDLSEKRPAIRKSGTITVKFSERIFPSPARESTFLQEQEWLEKQAEARRKIGFDSKDLKPEENDPLWLNDKGNDFFKHGNYLGAISAYTWGIKLSDKFACLYVNRSAAQYAIGNYFRCAEDCSKALELMVPHCESNLMSRARCHARFGAALIKLGSYKHGMVELEEAHRLLPDNEGLKRDIEAARKHFQSLEVDSEESKSTEL